KRIRKPDEGTNQSGQRYELKQLVRRVVKAGLRQFGCNDAPDEPDRKTEMLGENRPDEITSGNGLACGFPELRILRVPVRNPGRVPLAHQCVPFRFGERKTTNAAPPRSKAFLPGRRRCLFSPR